MYTILDYKLKNNLSREQVAERIVISETEDILFRHIEEFTLDRLIIYTSRLLSPVEINITVEQKNSSFHV